MFQVLNSFVNDEVNNVKEPNTLIASQKVSDVINYGDPEAANKFLSKVKESYDVSELEELLLYKGSMVVGSDAGSGKTTFLLIKLIYDILDGRFTFLQTVAGVQFYCLAPILVCTFLKSGASEVKAEFLKFLEKFKIEGIPVSCITFATIHAEVYSVWKSLGVEPNIQSEDLSVLKEIVTRQKLKRASSKSKSLSAVDLQELNALVSYARNRLDNTRYEHPLMQDFGLDKVTLDLIIKQCSELRTMLGVRDFEDTEELLLDAYKVNPTIVSYVGSRYKGIYIDEFQDTSQLQYALLKPYLDASTFMVVGDTNQAIYSWRGSDVSIMDEKIFKDYDVKEFHLTLNRRTAKNILDCVAPSIKINLKKARDFRSSVDGGELRTVMKLPMFFSSCVKKDFKNAKSIAVLGRTNNSLITPIVQLLVEGIPFTATKGCTLSGVYSQFTALFSLFKGAGVTELGRVLRAIYPYGSYEVSRLTNMLSCNPGLNLYNLDMDDLAYSCPKLYPFISELRSVMPKGLKSEDAELKVGLLWAIDKLRDTFNSKYSISYVNKSFCDYLEWALLQGPLKEKSFTELEVMFTKDFPLLLRSSISDTPQDQKVTVSTIHTAKGKEWDSVYIWASDTDFPYTMPLINESSEYLAEERRIFYIAVTRAKGTCTFFTNKDYGGTFIPRRYFLAECALHDSTLAYSYNGKVVFSKLSNLVNL